jgi:predicted HTH domain antitoxin
MSLTIELPEQLEREIKDRLDEDTLTRMVLEVVLIEAYRQRLISRRRVGEFLGLDFEETERFFQERGIPYNYAAEDFEQDGKTLEQLFAKRQPK